MKRDFRITRRLLLVFMLCILLSGLTAIPIERELKFIISHFPFDGSIKGWLQEVLLAVQHTGKEYPYLFYEYDWLAFAHALMVILFIGPLLNPIKNKWVIEFGVIANLLVIPFVLVSGHFREIPFWWRLADCFFSIAGLVPLIICLQKIKILEAEEKEKLERKQNYDLLVA